MKKENVPKVPDEVVQLPKVLPEIKLLKLRNGESIIAMVEWSSKPEDEGLITLYNPMKLVNPKYQTSDGETKVLMEEWLPKVVVSEQLCTIWEEDTIVISDVNENFKLNYQALILRRIAMDEIMRSGELNDKVAENMYRAENETSEEESEEFVKNMDEKLKKWRDRFN
jgi:hypothetical protein